jgi:ubiquinone/menaquinone biosynthesis C-methylase UbiE
MSTADADATAQVGPDAASADKLFYDSETLEGQAEYYRDYIAPYTAQWLPEIREAFAGRRDIRLLDLGAGSCTTSLVLSVESFVASIAAADISVHRMRRMSEEVARTMDCRPEKLEFHEIDFNRDLPFADDSFDLVLMDAALHHSRNIWHTLGEIRRVLVPEGHFVAQREAFASPLTHRVTFRRILESPEAAAGVSENAYLKSQYDYYLRVNGFVPHFGAVFPEKKFKLLFFLNGLLFSKYNIVARSTKHRAEAPGADASDSG